MVHARARRVAAALATVFLGLVMTAGPAAAKVRVGIENTGSDPVTVTASGGPAITVNVTSGCREVPPEDVTLAVCLPGGGFLVFNLNPGSALFGAD
jgi:ABC-type amino acid transport substrate-binding protein